MTDLTVAALAPIGTSAAPGVPDPALAVSAADPAQARHFAQLMSMPEGAASARTGGADPVQRLAQTLGRELANEGRTLDELRSSMLASVDLRDPIGTMFALTDHSLEAQVMFAKLHISSGLASAATSLFGTLLKNQQ